jgi:hypothetical protein
MKACVVAALADVPAVAIVSEITSPEEFRPTSVIDRAPEPLAVSFSLPPALMRRAVAALACGVR